MQSLKLKASWNKYTKYNMIKPLFYTAPQIEESELLQSSLICYSGDNENYGDNPFEWPTP